MLIHEITALLKRNDGVAAIEFAAIIPLLSLTLIAVVDLGMGFQAKMSVSAAAQAGSYYAILNGFNAAAITTAVANAGGPAGISANPAPSQSCGCPTGSGIQSTSCGSTCSNGAAAGTYVTVSAQYQYTTIFRYPLLTSPMNLSSSSTVRIK